ncbi:MULTISPECIES: RrF2 family transcriptional regulator [unclassified Streptomyces]|uniref:RrF2 family transcriptional regulator n=1 Tax=unclassified Streptomyces TaxID=2593676 RepID=UPI0036E21A6A
MQISAKADYAVRALVELAADSARPLTCEGIASAQEIPFRFLKSVFRDLRSAGLVRSQRGCEGGYWLGRAADVITVAEVMTAVDGEFFTVRGERPGVLDHHGSGGRVADLWCDVESAAHALLARTTIGELARGGAAVGHAEGGRGPEAAAGVPA